MPNAQNLDASSFNEQDAALREQFQPPLDNVTALLLRRQDLHAQALAALLRDEDVLRRRLEAAEAAQARNAPALQAAWMHVPIGPVHSGSAGALRGGDGGCGGGGGGCGGGGGGCGGGGGGCGGCGS